MQSTVASTSKRPIEDQDGPTPQRKKRVAAACDSCKRRKIRCDGQSFCANCTAAGLVCSYASTGLKKKGRPDSTIRALKAAQQAEQGRSSEGAELQPDQIPTLPPAFPDFLSNTSTNSGSTPGASASVSFAPVDGSLQTLASVASRPHRAKRIDEIVSRATVEVLVRLYFERLHLDMPIIAPAPFWQSFKQEEDVTNDRFYSILVALCSAICVSMHSEPMPEELQARYGTWEEAGRAFNAAVPPKRTRDMFADRSALVVQNIMLIAIYEKNVGSNIAMHLVNEAIRFAIAYHYDREDPSVSPLEGRTRKLIFFTLYQWSTYSSLLSGNPLAIRTDESHVSMPSTSEGAFAMPWIEGCDLNEETALEAFNTSTTLCLAVEAAILAYHADMRSFLRGNDVRTNFRQSIQSILSATEDSPAWLHPLSDQSKENESIKQSTSLIYIHQQVSCIELYHRYQSLVAADHHSIGHYHQARIGGQIAGHLSKMSSKDINRLGPSAIDMLYHAREYLQESLTHLDDPSALAQAKSDLKLFDAHVKNVDSLRRVNAIIKRPRAYRPEASTKPSRASSPVASAPAFTNGELEKALSPFNPSTAWNPATFADPSIGSMAFMNNLPFLDVQNYAEASMAYAQSFWDTDFNINGEQDMQGQQFQ